MKKCGSILTIGDSRKVDNNNVFIIASTYCFFNTPYARNALIKI